MRRGRLELEPSCASSASLVCSWSGARAALRIRRPAALAALAALAASMPSAALAHGRSDTPARCKADGSRYYSRCPRARPARPHHFRRRPCDYDGPRGRRRWPLPPASAMMMTVATSRTPDSRFSRRLRPAHVDSPAMRADLRDAATTSAANPSTPTDDLLPSCDAPAIAQPPPPPIPWLLIFLIVVLIVVLIFLLFALLMTERRLRTLQVTLPTEKNKPTQRDASTQFPPTSEDLAADRALQTLYRLLADHASKSGNNTWTDETELRRHLEACNMNAAIACKRVLATEKWRATRAAPPLTTASTATAARRVAIRGTDSHGHPCLRVRLRGRSRPFPTSPTRTRRPF